MDKDNITPGGTSHFSWPITIAAILISVMAGAWMILKRPEQATVTLVPLAPTSTKHVAPTLPPLPPTEVEASLGELDSEFAQMDTDINNIDDLDGF